MIPLLCRLLCRLFGHVERDVDPWQLAPSPLFPRGGARNVECLRCGASWGEWTSDYWRMVR